MKPWEKIISCLMIGANKWQKIYPWWDIFCEKLAAYHLWGHFCWKTYPIWEQRRNLLPIRDTYWIEIYPLWGTTSVKNILWKDIYFQKWHPDSHSIRASLIWKCSPPLGWLILFEVSALGVKAREPYLSYQTVTWHVNLSANEMWAVNNKELYLC